MDAIEFKKKIALIYQTADELGREFKISSCTPDGHLLGAIGQIAAKMAFDLKKGSEEQEHNSTWVGDNKIINIQVRSTGRGSIALRKEPEHLIALDISELGKIRLLYNGPGYPVWEMIKHQKQPQKYATKNQLRLAQSEVDKNSMIPIRNNIFDL